MVADTPRCYSYIRFSTSEQLKGDSLRRQLELTREYADKHGLVLDESLSMRDLGFQHSAVKTGPAAPWQVL